MFLILSLFFFFFSLFQTKEHSLVLPDGVLRTIRSQSCDAADVVAQMEESVENLQLKPAALVDPTPESKEWIRCLPITAKYENRTDMVTHLRSIAPPGTTGELTVGIKVVSRSRDKMFPLSLKHMLHSFEHLLGRCWLLLGMSMITPENYLPCLLRQDKTRQYHCLQSYTSWFIDVFLVVIQNNKML